jgi:hypothetical protein
MMDILQFLKNYSHILLEIVASLIQYTVVILLMYNVITFNFTTLITDYWYVTITIIIIVVTNLQILFKSILYNYLVTDYTKILYRNFFDRVNVNVNVNDNDNDNNSEGSIKILEI